MPEEFWKEWMQNSKKAEQDFQEYLFSKKISREPEAKELVEGHMQKADHNLRFAKTTINLKEFNDWAIVTSYYAIYQASLALCALKGYSSKDHNATLLILIREFYRKELTKEEIETIANTTIEKEEVLYYIEAKAKRKKASYSAEIIFDREDAENLRLKAITFVNKAKNIIDSFRN